MKLIRGCEIPEGARFGSLEVVAEIRSRGRRRLKYLLFCHGCSDLCLFDRKDLSSRRTCGCKNKRMLPVTGKRMSIAEAAKKLGVDRSTLGHRLRNGWSIKDAVHKKPQNKQRIFLVEGKELTYAQIKKVYGVERGTLRHRLNTGWSIEQAVGLSPRTDGRRIRKICVEGKELTYAQIERLYGINRYTLQQRLDRGWSAERAVGSEVEFRRRRRIRVDGKDLTYAQVEKMYGVKKATLQYRLNQGWSVERAVRSKVARKICVEGKDLTLIQMEKVYGVKRRTIAYRLSKGWSVERAIGLERADS